MTYPPTTPGDSGDQHQPGSGSTPSWQQPNPDASSSAPGYGAPPPAAGQGHGGQPDPAGQGYGTPAGAPGQGYGTPAGAPGQGYGTPAGAPGQGYYAPGPGGPGYAGTTVTNRPVTVTIASILTWIGGVLIVAGGAALLAARDMVNSFLSDEQLDEELAGAGVSGDEFIAVADGVLIALGVLFLLWGGLLILFGTFAFRGARWAVWVLTVFAAIYLALSIFATLTEPTTLVGILWVVGAIVLYHLTPSREWYGAGAPKAPSTNYGPPQ